jgi:hypothetical protein
MSMRLATLAAAGAIGLSAPLLTATRPAANDSDAARLRQIEERCASLAVWQRQL